MSIICPMAACKAQPGMCKCEKIMSVVIAVAAAFFLFRHFA